MSDRRVPPAWEDELARTWLGKPPIVAEYDAWVRTCFRVHRGLAQGAEQGVSPWSVEDLVADVERFTKTQVQPRWLWSIAAMANLSELLFCAEDGGIKPSRSVRRDRQLSRAVERLQLVRNVCFHPAFQKAQGADRPHVVGLVDALRNDDAPEARELAAGLEKDWANFGTKPTASFTLRTLNSAGVLYARALRDRRAAFTSEDSDTALRKMKPPSRGVLAP